MIRLMIDNRDVEVPEGSTILQAARQMGLDIPALCYLDGCQPNTSCMLCLVKLQDGDRFVPSCATPAENGMVVESETPEVHQLRKTGLELLLSDHLGECTAPCQSACPTHMNIPLMLRQVAAGELREAIVTIKKDMALPAALGRLCSDFCERACRRGHIDEPAALCLVKRYVAEKDLASASPYVPPRQPDSGKRVAIMGAGPSGLSAAYHLLQEGHACTLFDERAELGGSLRYEIDESRLPRDLLDAEIAIITQLGARFRTGAEITLDAVLGELGDQFDAILLTSGPLGEEDIERLDVAVTQDRPQIDNNTYRTGMTGVFLVSEAVRSDRSTERCVAEGKTVAACIDQYLRGGPVTGLPRPFGVHAGRPTSQDLEELLKGASREARVQPREEAAMGLSDEEARAEALRCLHCDCGQQHDCGLRHYAALYGAGPRSYPGEAKALEIQLQHADIVYEPGKCILCGLCIQIATEAGEPLGLTFVGRGFDVRVEVPFDRSIAEGLKLAARRCAEACPTGALVLRDVGRSGTCSSCRSCDAPQTGENDC